MGVYVTQAEVERGAAGKRYVVRTVKGSQLMTGGADAARWADADVAQVACFREESSDHRPETTVRLMHSTDGIHGLFRVKDRFVRAVQTEYMSSVCGDSCVEWFVRPRADCGYFNFEFNCGGALLCSYITDPSRVENGFKEWLALPREDGEMVIISHSMPDVVEPEIDQLTEWWLSFFVPFGVMEKYVGALGAVSGQVWRANMYKCGDKTSHPHWASWNPVGELNFHAPQFFGSLVME